MLGGGVQATSHTGLRAGGLAWWLQHAFLAWMNSTCPFAAQPQFAALPMTGMVTAQDSTLEVGASHPLLRQWVNEHRHHLQQLQHR